MREPCQSALSSVETSFRVAFMLLLFGLLAVALLSVTASTCTCFGAYVHIDKSRRRKLDDRAWKGIFVSYAADSPVWLVYNPRTRRVERSRNVDFDEMALMGSVSVGEKAPSAKDDDGVPVFFEEPVERSGGDTASG